MKKQVVLFLLLPLFTLILTACGDEADYENEDAFYDETYEQDQPSDEAETSFTDDEAPLTAADCYEDETYDPDTQSCYIDIVCEDDAECELALAELYTDKELAAEIYGDLDEYLTDSYSGQNNTAPSAKSTDPIDTTIDTAVLPNDLSGGDPELPTITRYILDDTLNIQLRGIDNSQPTDQINEARHQEIWTFLRRILPPTLLKSDVAEYHIFTDGADETLAYVAPLTSDSNMWVIGIDIQDVGAAGKINTGDFVHTVIHEFAHILTLENNQVPPDTSNVAEGEESDIALACATFYTGEGCALAGSYINQFFNKFWADVYYNEFQDIEWAETDEEY